MRLLLTKNLNKAEHFVNGTVAHVDAYDSRSGCLTVITKTSKRLDVSKIVENIEGYGTVACFPARVGYAGTVRKVQGQTLPHVTLYLDRINCKAAGYVALSRVSHDNEYLIAGKVTDRHFVPAM